MIPNNNLFTGALGKSQYISGSSCFSTPHSVNVPVQYSINTNFIGEFVASSLDGRLWCLKRSARYTFFTLIWNPDSLLLEFAASLARSGENFIARGLDWILTDKSFVRVLDDEPYILVYNLFDDYSALTLDDFSSIEHCFSLLPPIGNFQLFQNFLIRRENNGNILNRVLPLSFSTSSRPDAHEFINNSHAISCNNFQLIAHNGELWGAGLSSFGQVFLLPAVFNLDGSVLSYYLYFQNCSSEFNLSLFSDDNSIAPAFFGDNLYGFIYDHHQNLCSVSKDNNIFNLNSTAWENLSEHNGFIFADPFASRGLLLDSEGVTILHELNSRLDCKTLPQWVAPAGNIDALDVNLFAASDDSSAFLTLLDSAFSREVMYNKVLPLSAPSASGYRFSLGLSKSNNRNLVLVNQSLSQSKTMQPVLWDNVYKNPFDFQFLHSDFNVPIYQFIFYDFRGLFYEDDGTYTSVSSLCNFRHMASPFFLKSEPRISFLTEYNDFSVTMSNDIEHVLLDSQLGFAFDNDGADYYFNHHWYRAAFTEIQIDLFFFNPLDGSIQGPVTLSSPVPYEIGVYSDDNGDSWMFIKKRIELKDICIHDNQIGLICSLFSREYIYDNYMPPNGETIFIPLYSIPEHLFSWCNDPQYSHSGEWWFSSYNSLNKKKIGEEALFSDGLRFQSDSINEVLNNEKLSTVYAAFYESSTNTPFYLDVSHILQAQDIARMVKSNVSIWGTSSFADRLVREYAIDFASLSDNSQFSFTPSGKKKFNHNLHFIAIKNGFIHGYEGNIIDCWDIYIFRSVLHNDIFDFDAELERSYHS